MPELKEVVYKDFANSFAIHPITKKLSILTNADSIKQSVKNIVLTNFYERPYKPNFGANLLAQLFENMDPLTEVVIKQNIERAIENHEPRARIINLVVFPDYDNNLLNVRIEFSVRNLLENLVVDIVVERVR